MAGDPVPAKPARIEWLDAGRAVVLASMVWVNDIAGVKAAPGWMKHFEPPDGNGMTFVDVVFPAFLFIVGMAIPAAMASRRAKGEAVWETGYHVIVRTVGLLLAGVMMVNIGRFDAAGVGWRPGMWGLTVFVSLIMLFISGPWEKNKALWWVGWLTKLLGAVALVWLVSIFKGKNGSAFDPQWWGILGLIGWAYLMAAAIVMLARGKVFILVPVAAALLGMWYADKWGHWFNGWWLEEQMDIGGALGTQAAISLLGAAFFVMVKWGEERSCATAIMMSWLVVMGAATAALYPLGGFNKNYATPAWAAASVGCTIGLLWLVREAGKISPRWAWAILCLAGTNVLMGYLLSGTWYQMIMSGEMWWYGKLVAGDAAMWKGIARASAASMANLLIVAALARASIRLRL